MKNLLHCLFICEKCRLRLRTLMELRCLWGCWERLLTTTFEKSLQEFFGICLRVGWDQLSNNQCVFCIWATDWDINRKPEIRFSVWKENYVKITKCQIKLIHTFV